MSVITKVKITKWGEEWDRISFVSVYEWKNRLGAYDFILTECRRYKRAIIFPTIELSIYIFLTIKRQVNFYAWNTLLTFFLTNDDKKMGKNLSTQFFSLWILETYYNNPLLCRRTPICMKFGIYFLDLPKLIWFDFYVHSLK